MNIAMQAVKPLDKEITHYLGYLNADQKKAVLGVVKNFAREEYAWWEDKDFVKELDRRTAELESGKVKGITLDELESRVRAAYKNRKRKKK
jgi:putative addiction module component (TIGR02574 family)